MVTKGLGSVMLCVAGLAKGRNKLGMPLPYLVRRGKHGDIKLLEVWLEALSSAIWLRNASDALIFNFAAA